MWAYCKTSCDVGVSILEEGGGGAGRLSCVPNLAFRGATGPDFGREKSRAFSAYLILKFQSQVTTDVFMETF